MNIFKKWFAPLDEQNLEIKIRINPVWQEEAHICHYSCEGFWKLSSGFFWKNIGIVHQSGYGGKVDKLTQKDYDKFLEITRVKVLNHLRNNDVMKKKLSIPIKELDL